MRTFLLIIVLLCPSIFAAGNELKGYTYCVVQRSYTGLGNLMKQTLVFKENKKHQIKKMNQYSYSEIYLMDGSKTGELREVSYQVFPYEKTAEKSILVSLLNSESKKKLPKEAFEEIKFIKENILKYKVEFPCPYRLKALFDRSTLVD